MARPLKKRAPGELYQEKVVKISPVQKLVDMKKGKKKVGLYGLI